MAEATTEDKKETPEATPVPQTDAKPEATDELLMRLETDIAQTLAALNLERRGKNRPERVKEYTDALESFKRKAVKFDLGKPKRATLDMLKGMVKERQHDVLHAMVASAVEAVEKANVSMGDLTNDNGAFTVTAAAKCRYNDNGDVVILNLSKLNAFRIGPTVKRTVKK